MRRTIESQPLDCHKCNVRSLAPCEDLLESSEGSAGATGYKITNFKPRHTLVRFGETPDGVQVLRKGWAFQYMITPNGSRQILWFALPGEPLTSLLGERSSYAVETLTHCDLCLLPALDAPPGRQPAATCSFNLLRLVDAQQRACRERIVVLGQLNALERVANLLDHLRRRLAVRGLAVEESFEFPLRNAHVADALGLTAVHVSRVFRELAKRGVAEREEGRIRLGNARLLGELGRVSADRAFPGPIS